MASNQKSNPVSMQPDSQRHTHAADSDAMFVDVQTP
jgi:hypothetical protein